MSLRGHPLLAFGCETGSTEHGLPTFLDAARLEGNLARCSALGADGIVHLTIAEFLRFARRTAVLATLGSAQVLALIEFLFTAGEHEGPAAVAAGKLLISHNLRKKGNKE